MRDTTFQFEIRGKNHTLIYIIIIYPTEKTIHWNKQHFGMRLPTDPLFFYTM